MGSGVDKVDEPFEFLDPKLLCLFDLIHSTGSVTRAAEQLGQSQPTVSIWLAKLRAVLNDPLFVRTPSGMLPTPRADALIGAVRDALSSMRQITVEPEGFHPEQAQRKFRISMTDAGHVTLLPRILEHLRAVAPRVALEAARIDADTGKRLIAGDVDLAIGLVPELDTGFYQQTLFEEDWVCVANARHPRLGGDLSLPQYKAEAHVAIASRSGALLQAALMRQRIERRVLLELPGFLGLPAIVSSTDLIATLPIGIGEALARSAGLSLFPCPVLVPSFAIKQHWHTRYHHDPANRWLRGVVCALHLQDPSSVPRRNKPKQEVKSNE